MRDNKRGTIDSYPFQKRHSDIKQLSKRIHVAREQIEHGQELYTEYELMGEYEKARKVLAIATDKMIELDTMEHLMEMLKGGFFDKD